MPQQIVAKVTFFFLLLCRILLKLSHKLKPEPCIPHKDSIDKSPGQGPVKPAVGDPASAGGLD